MAVWVVVMGLYQASHWWVSLMHAVNIAVLCVTTFVTVMYARFFAKRDLLKTDDEEID